jgi:hypothetical protein
MSMRNLMMVATMGALAASGCSAGNWSDGCTKVNNCYFDDSGIPTCNEGYTWQDPTDNANLTCVEFGSETNPGSTDTTGNNGTNPGDTGGDTGGTNGNTGGTDNGNNNGGNNGNTDTGGNEPGNTDTSSDCSRAGFTAASQAADYSEAGNFTYRAVSGTSAPVQIMTIDSFIEGFGGPSAPGTFDLSGMNYADCGLCLLVLADCADAQGTGCTKYFYADEGSVTISQFGQDGGVFSGSMSNVIFKEVTIDSETFTSTPVVGGETWCMDGTSFSANIGASNPGGDNGGGNTGGNTGGDTGGDNGGGTTQGDCPDNAHTGDPSINSGEQAGYCYCDPGYFVNEEGTGCVAECETDSDCSGGDVCIDNSCRPAPCTEGSCPDGTVCDDSSGYCIQDLGIMPPEPNLNCDVLIGGNCELDDYSCIPGWQCSGSDCNNLVAYSPRVGNDYWDYPLNGETEVNQYRSFIRGDVRNLVAYSSAWVRCMTKDRWDFGSGSNNEAALGLGDMSEANGDIPGESIGSPGHPPGTHVDGSDMDIGYYQLGAADNKLRSVCEHYSGGQDQYHCVAPPTSLDVWRTALVLAKMHDNPGLRVIGVDGQIGQLVDSAITQMCGAGWLSGTVCNENYRKITYELTDGGAGWYRFHHHHFHISVNSSKSSGSVFDNSCLTASCEQTPEVSMDPRRTIYRGLKTRLRN